MPPVHVGFTKYVALLCACMENEAGPPGSWTEEQVLEGEKRERETLAYVWAKKHTGNRPVNAEDTSRACDRAKGHEYMYI